MARPVFLVIEVEQPDGLSSRKLVLETHKHNVLTAHSGHEGLEIAKKHPVNAIVVHDQLPDMRSEELTADLKKVQPAAPIVLITPTIKRRQAGVHKVISSHEPHELLQALEEIAGKPPDAPESAA